MLLSALKLFFIHYFGKLSCFYDLWTFTLLIPSLFKISALQTVCRSTSANGDNADTAEMLQSSATVTLLLSNCYNVSAL